MLFHKALVLCPNAGYVLKFGTCCALLDEANLGDVAVMGAVESWALDVRSWRTATSVT